jgi:hypothetical protein
LLFTRQVALIWKKRWPRSKPVRPAVGCSPIADPKSF